MVHGGVGELVERWSLDGDDRRLVGNKTGVTRLGFAVLLKFFEIEARFPTDRAEVPVEAVAFLADQVGVEFASLGSYDWSGRSWKRHRAPAAGEAGGVRSCRRRRAAHLSRPT